MGGESKKLTAAQKGKAISVEKEGKTKEKRWETAVNAPHAAELMMRGGGIHIRDNAPADTQTPESPVPSNRTIGTGMDTTGTPGSEANPARTLASRKRTRADVDPVQETALEVEGQNNDNDFLKSSCSVVTVASVMKNAMQTIYRTGFILIAEENYCVVFTSCLPTGDTVREYFVHFKDEKTRTKAFMLTRDDSKEFSILVVETVKKHSAVMFDDNTDLLDNEAINTFCALSGSKLNAEANAPVMEELEGSLGSYDGEVTTATYDASDYKFGDVAGAEEYFQLTCDVHDDIITLENIDRQYHTANIVVSSPVFRENGKAIGIVYSCGVWIDVKDALFAKSIISWIKTNLDMDDTCIWEEELKNMAKEQLDKVQEGQKNMAEEQLDELQEELNVQL